ASDPGILGRRLRIRGPQERAYEIVGVLQNGFTGVEPGVLTDIWVPNMTWSAQALDDPRQSWFRVWGRLRPGVTASQAAAVLQPTFSAFWRARLRDADLAPDQARRYLGTQLNARPAGNGPSLLRKTYERPLWVLMGV